MCTLALGFERRRLGSVYTVLEVRSILWIEAYKYGDSSNELEQYTIILTFNIPHCRSEKSDRIAPQGRSLRGSNMLPTQKRTGLKSLKVTSGPRYNRNTSKSGGGTMTIDELIQELTNLKPQLDAGGETEVLMYYKSDTVFIGPIVPSEDGNVYLLEG